MVTSKNTGQSNEILNGEKFYGIVIKKIGAIQINGCTT